MEFGCAEGRQPITQNKESSPNAPIHSFHQLCWLRSFSKLIGFHSFTYRAFAWFAARCFLFALLLKKLIKLIPFTNSRQKQQRSLSSSLFEWMKFALFGLVLFLLRSIAAAAAHNPQKKDKPKANHIHQTAAVFIQLKINFIFNFIQSSPCSALLINSFHSLLNRRSQPPNARQQPKQSILPIRKKRMELLLVCWMGGRLTSAAAAVHSIQTFASFDFIKFNQIHKSFHSMNMQQLYWRQITVIISFLINQFNS